MTRKSVLLVTLPPLEGGVPALTSLLAHFLTSRNYAVTVGYYATYGSEPDLVVPFWRLLSGRRPACRKTLRFGDIKTIGVGCWFPEMEIPYYLPSRLWSRLLERFDYHVVVGGNVLTGYRMIRYGLRHFIWCATPFLEERKDRQARMSLLRRLIDRSVLVPILGAMERYVLSRSDMILTISRYTANRFRAMGRKGPMDVLIVPVDCNEFVPPATPAPAGVVGFAGRYLDPRKNISMLIEAVAILRKKGTPVSLRLTGEPDTEISAVIERHGLGAAVEFTGFLDRNELPAFYQSLDVFALPSRQEGLGIVGIEAMAAGVPVVSTRNGGAEDYVSDGENGLLVGFSAQEMASALGRFIEDRDFRNRAAFHARKTAVDRYSLKTWHAGVEAAWLKVWGEPL
ncbi:MAG: glycosyltransferase family 4 protein [Rhodospirillales bacterium]